MSDACSNFRVEAKKTLVFAIRIVVEVASQTRLCPFEKSAKRLCGRWVAHDAQRAK